MRTILVGILSALVIAAFASPLCAEGCRSWCERKFAKCKMACADAPVPGDCRANCQVAFNACLDTCS